MPLHFTLTNFSSVAPCSSGPWLYNQYTVRGCLKVVVATGATYRQIVTLWAVCRKVVVTGAICRQVVTLRAICRKVVVSCDTCRQVMCQVGLR